MRKLILAAFMALAPFAASADTWSPAACANGLSPANPRCTYSFVNADGSTPTTAIQNQCRALALEFIPATGGAGTVQGCADVACADPRTIATLTSSMFPGPYVSGAPMIRVSRTAPAAGTAAVMLRCGDNLALGQVPGSRVTGAVPTATALAADGANCAAGQWAAGVDASGAAQGCTVDAVGGGATPTGTGFRHVTAGVEDAASKLVDTADVNADQITYAKMQNVSATSRFLGRITAGAGDTEELTGTQATTLLDNFTAGLNGLAPLSGGGTTNFLRADATWAAPPGGTPGGADTQVQFNDAGAFGGDAQYVWNKTTNTLTVGDATTQGFLDVKCPTPGSMDCETTYVEDTAFGGTPAAGFRKLQARSDGFYEIDSAAVTRRLLAGGAVEVTLDFGASGAADASVVVTGQAWVTATTEIVCSPTMMATADRAEGAQDAILEGLVVAAYSRVAGTGFTLAGAPRFGNAIGKYAIHCVGA